MRFHMLYRVVASDISPESIASHSRAQRGGLLLISTMRSQRADESESARLECGGDVIIVVVVIRRPLDSAEPRTKNAYKL